MFLKKGWRKNPPKTGKAKPPSRRLDLESLERRDVMSSSSATAYLVPVAPNLNATAILTTGDTVPAVGGGTYQMAGIPDGLGAFDNGDGTFTVLMNHELGSTSGAVHAHGSVGAFVSKLVIDKATLNVLSGEDLIKSVNLASGATTTAFGRFCSADLPAISAFYNAATGLGTQERIFMNGEEIGVNGRGFGTVVSTGTAYELPRLGKMSFENSLANPFAQDKTLVMSNSDGSPGYVYLYVGTKTNTGSAVDKAGLTNGSLYVVKVNGLNAETRDFGLAASGSLTTTGTFSLFKLGNNGDVSALSGTQINTDSGGTTGGNGTTFLRPEDGAWDPTHPNDYYFVTTDRFDQVQDGLGAQVGRSRLWRLHYTDLANPEAGGTIEMLLDGTEGGNMFDNMTIDGQGRILLQEDVGNQVHNGKIWAYDIATDSLMIWYMHDPARFGDVGLAPTAPFTIDEESSGIIDVSSIFGPGAYLADVQAHYTNPDPNLVEGGQLLLLRQTAATAALQGGKLTLFGSAANDDIRVNITNDGDVIVKVAGQDILTVAGTDVDSVVGNGFDGNDRINVSDEIDVPAFLRGGRGNDRLFGGGGNDILMGDEGNDELYGRAGHDLLIGGLGSDVIQGGRGNDLVVGGTTAYDANPLLLQKISDSWTSPGSYNKQVAKLRTGANGVPKLDLTTVFDDQVKDWLYGEAGFDWFWAGLSDLHDKKVLEAVGP